MENIKNLGGEVQTLNDLVTLCDELWPTMAYKLGLTIYYMLGNVKDNPKVSRECSRTWSLKPLS